MISYYSIFYYTPVAPDSRRAPRTAHHERRVLRVGRGGGAAAVWYSAQHLVHRLNMYSVERVPYVMRA